ncbi:MAG: FMN-binding protein [Clostridia bacterium]|nr:FMN-binding protein [Clostridia bacterium]
MNFLTKEKISENQQKLINDEIRNVFYEGEIEPVNFAAENTSVTDVYRIIATTDNQILGYSVICKPKGFGGEISMLVAYDYEKTISAVRIIKHSETPGIGDKIENSKQPWFTEQFIGRSSNLTFGKDDVDKISGSSKSSAAVLKGINDATSVISGIE